MGRLFNKKYDTHKSRRNIVLPNFITMLGLLCGVYSLVAVSNGELTRGAVAIILAGVFDGLDGKVARLVNGTSEFGVQLDSLADVISFGVAPAFLLYNWLFTPYKQLGLMLMFLYVACGALRLARFNVQTKKISNIFFVGMPIPAAAAIVAASVLFIKRVEMLDAPWLPITGIIFALVLGFLMVSTLPFYSFKNLSFVKARPFNIIVILVVILFFVGLEPAIGIFTLSMLYLLSGFVMLPFRKRLLLKLEKTQEAAEI